jgi:hypothetical protein
LQQRLDGRPGRDADLEVHLAGCPDCRELHAAAGRLEDGLRQLAPPVPPPELAVRVVARVLAQRRAAARRRRVLVGCALAASLLLGYLAAPAWLPPDDGPGERQFALRWLNWIWPRPALQDIAIDIERGDLMEIDVRPPSPAPSLRASVAEAVAGLTSRLADETVGPTRGLLEDIGPPAPPSPQTPDPPGSPLREARQGATVCLEPVATSARRAVDLFLRELPPLEPEPKSGL